MLVERHTQAVPPQLRRATCPIGRPPSLQAEPPTGGRRDVGTHDAALTDRRLGIVLRTVSVEVVAGDTESMPVPIPEDGVISLRPWRCSDATWYAEASRDAAIQRFTTEPADLTAADVVAALRVSNARADRAAFLVCSADGVRRLGNLAVEYCGDVAHVSYWVAADARGQGVAARALSLLLTMLRDDTQVRVVDLWTHVDNIGSRRAAEQAGYIRDPTADCERIVKGTRMADSRLPRVLTRWRHGTVSR